MSAEKSQFYSFMLVFEDILRSGFTHDEIVDIASACSDESLLYACFADEDISPDYRTLLCVIFTSPLKSNILQEVFPEACRIEPIELDEVKSAIDHIITKEEKITYTVEEYIISPYNGHLTKMRY